MAKKEVRVEEVEAVFIKPIKKKAKIINSSNPKIHLDKYFNEDSETPDFFRPMLKVVLGSGMNTREEWKRLIKEELNRSY